MVKNYHKRWFFVNYLPDEYVSSTIILRKLWPVYFVLSVVKRFEVHSPHKNMKSHHAVAGKIIRQKAGRCQSYTNFFPEELSNVCGAREVREI